MHRLLSRSLPLMLALVFRLAGSAQATFDVASIRLSQKEVKFERDGETQISAGTLRMRDVRLSTCIRFAYKVQQAQIVGLPGMDDQHYDIIAKAPQGTTEEQMRPMLQALLAERFHLAFHREQRALDGYILTVLPKGIKFKSSIDQHGEMFRENSAMGMVGKNITMQELADYVSGPLEAPLADGTNLPGEYDLAIDFTKYVDGPRDILSSVLSVLNATFKGDLGLQLTRSKGVFDMIVVDGSQPPTEN